MSHGFIIPLNQLLSELGIEYQLGQELEENWADPKSWW